MKNNIYYNKLYRPNSICMDTVIIPRMLRSVPIRIRVLPQQILLHCFGSGAEVVNRDNSSNVGSKAKRKSSKGPIGLIGKANLTLFIQIFGKLVGHIFDATVIRDLLEKTVQAHDKLLIDRGTKHGTKHWKELTRYCIGLLEGRKPKPLAWTKIGTKDRWPHRFNFMRPIFHNIIDNTKDTTKKDDIAKLRQFLQTLLSVNKVCEGFKELDVEHLLTTFTLKNQTIEDFEKFVIQKIDSFRDSKRFDSTLVMDPFFGPSNGPNGKPKLQTADMEAYGLVNSPLFEHINNMCELTENNSFVEYVQFRSEKYNLKQDEDKLDPKDIVLRKLTSIPDKGNKSRVIALSDIWTQAALKPVEEQVIRATEYLYKDNCAFFGHSKG